MNLTIEQLYQEIGQAALAIADDLAGRLLVYAEVEDGVVSADLFYVDTAGVVRFRICPWEMQELVYLLWQRWQEHPGNPEWRVMCYIIDGGKFRIQLTYPDQVNKDEDLSDRQPLAIKKYFGDMKVDYSNP